jgi:ABC-2 type transport system permease protein
VNPQHFRAFLWLRWRLRVNQIRRAGTANAIILGILAVGAVLLAIGSFVMFLLIGLFALNDEKPVVILYVFDGLVVALLFCWMVGLLTDLQRAEALTLDKFMHLPVSLTGAFLINYLSSLFSLTLLVFVPPLFALSLALIFTRGPMLLLTLPLLAAFLLMLTAVTYQFRGWLAALMVNKRRRNTIIVVVTALFILITQAPQVLNIMQPWGKKMEQRIRQGVEDRQKLQRKLAEEKLPYPEIEKRMRQFDEETRARHKEEDQQTWDYVQRIAWLANGVLPPGWLPYGAASAADGDVVPPLLGMFGMALIGTASLWRSYRTTVGLYKGEFTSGEKRRTVRPKPATTGPVAAILLEKRLPWLSEQACAITLATFRSLTRAPEAKMMLLTPIIMAVVFGAMFMRTGMNVPLAVRPLMAFGAMASILLGMIQLQGNQFGFDRSGFRVYVLSSAPRRYVLLGKNLGMAPLALGMSFLLVVLLECLPATRLRIDHFVAVLPQLVSVYLVFSLIANFLSIYAPIPVAPGAMRATSIRGIPLLLHILLAFLFPLVLAPLALPLGIEYLVEWQTGQKGLPVYLVLSLLEFAVVVIVYRLVLGWQGELLQAREKKILKVVAEKAE